MGAGRFAAADDGQRAQHVEALHEAGRTVMLQPYLADIDTVGETALDLLRRWVQPRDPQRRDAAGAPRSTRSTPKTTSCS